VVSNITKKKKEKDLAVYLFHMEYFYEKEKFLNFLDPENIFVLLSIRKQNQV
jgi:hypothetical protein